MPAAALPLENQAAGLMYDPPLHLATSPADTSSSAMDVPPSPIPSVTSATSEDGDDAALGVLSALKGPGTKQKRKRQRKSSESLKFYTPVVFDSNGC